MKLKKLVTMALLAAMSIVFVLLIHFPIFPAAAFLEYDPADIPLIIASFMYGPIAGLMVTFVTCALQAIIVSAGSGIIGFCMHFFATGAFAIVAGVIYKKKPSTKGLIVALISGVLCATLLMIPLNLIFTPMYGIKIDVVKQLMIPVILPFNLIKFGANSLIAFLVFSAVKKYIVK